MSFVDHNSPPYGKAAYMHVSSKCRPVGKPILHMKRCAYSGNCHNATKPIYKKDSKERQICVRDSFALCRDCIKGPNLPTHADMIGVNVSAFVVPNSLQYDQGNTNLIPLFAMV